MRTFPYLQVSFSGSAIHNVLPAAFQPGAQVAGGDVHQPLQGLFGGPGDVRREDGIGQTCALFTIRTRTNESNKSTCTVFFLFLAEQMKFMSVFSCKKYQDMKQYTIQVVFS